MKGRKENGFNFLKVIYATIPPGRQRQSESRGTCISVPSKHVWESGKKWPKCN